jgi:threonine dehydrogenase-like Zn-dependent dehydrogenase
MADMATAVVQTAPETYELRELPLPEIGFDDALLELEACGICGTDVEVFEGGPNRLYPIVPGHEPLGRIIRIGDGASAKWDVREGDRVAVHSTLTCGRCRTCRAGLRGCTAPEFSDSTIYGFRSPDVTPGLWGGFATHLYLAPEAMVLPVSLDLSVGAASLFNVMSNGVDWAIELGGVRAGMSVAILGPGPRGLASLIACKAAGAGPIAVTGLARDGERLAMARELGADAAIDVSGGNVAGSVVDALGEAPQLVIDTTPGAVDSVVDAIAMVAQRGMIVLAGLKGQGRTAPVPVDQVAAKQVTIRGAVSRALSSMQYAIELIESQRWPFDRLASDAFGLADAEQAVRSLMSDHPPLHARIEIGA